LPNDRAVDQFGGPDRIGLINPMHRGIESGRKMTVEVEKVKEAYRKYLCREADAGGLEHYATYPSIAQVEWSLVGSDEFKRNSALVRIPKCISAWKICIIDEAKLVYVPIAKNAHTSMMDALLKFKGIDWHKLPIGDAEIAEVGDEDSKMHSAIDTNFTGLLAKDFPPSFVDHALSSKEYLKVAVFRDPIDRFLSAYNHVFIREVENSVVGRHGREVYEALGIAPGAESVSLARFAKYLAGTPSFDLDPHWAPQYTFIEGIKIDHVIPIERLDLLRKIICARSGRKLEIGNLNVRPRARELGLCGDDAESVRLAEEIYWLDSQLYRRAQEKIAELDAIFS
jgi:hypothetical protein